MGVLTAALNVTYYSDSNCTNVLPPGINGPNPEVNPRCGPGANYFQEPHSWKIECGYWDGQLCLGLAFYANMTKCSNSDTFVPLDILQCKCLNNASQDDSNSCLSIDFLIGAQNINQTTLLWQTGLVSHSNTQVPTLARLPTFPKNVNFTNSNP